MESLTDEESWKLFCAYAFPESEKIGPPEHLKEVALNIVKKCAKLPLAIKTTAASLVSTTLPRDWQSKLHKLKTVATPSDPVMDILKVSYDSLPAHLKACFAYLAFFPEDEQIECEYLIHLWTGEGFIPAGENPWDCLDQLANLCLVEVWEEWNLIKYCKIHDLLLDLARLISRENRCAFNVEDALSKLRSVNTGGGRWCRLFLAKKNIDEHAISERRSVSPTLVHTLLLSGNSKIGRNMPAMLISGMRVLRVLDLSHTNISTLPACVGNMKLLRVLNLRGTGIKKVPKCVRSLKSLSFLDVSDCRGLEPQAPKWISELKCLQHLKGRFQRMPKGISKLESLRTLRGSFFLLSLSMERGRSVNVKRMLAR
ncbi:disease resistance RPP13-like protein 4 [Cryptomeria japonica]|uniref:disease resistance RPP13-like protein 4 n=1 Tax=Cryptomeria japonica TaxID=3369 RepID=UPI0027DA0765|nr:disease resistance RPP13-like protein 4 [Cryptomeria japonica]